MTPATRNVKPTAGALRAAKQIERNLSFIESTAEVIDRETGVRELVELLENIIAEAGDLIEGPSPELVAQAYAVMRHYGDESRRQAECREVPDEPANFFKLNQNVSPSRASSTAARLRTDRSGSFPGAYKRLTSIQTPLRGQRLRYPPCHLLRAIETVPDSWELVLP